MKETQVSHEKQRTMVLLCRYLGWFGAHRFYTGKTFTGILMLMTLGGLGIWVHIDLGLILTGKFTDKEGKPITNWS